MALESATYINGLVSTNPTSTDALAQADDHLRLIKTTIKATFPNVTGAVTATHTQLNQDPTSLLDSNGATRVAASTTGASVTGNISLSGSGLTLGTHTAGNYVAGITGGTGITVANSGSEGATPTVSIGQAVATSDTVTFAEVRSTGNVTAYYSDMRLKTDIQPIEGALDKVMTLNGFYFRPNAIAQDYGYEDKVEVGVSAQDVEAIMPEIIAEAPIDPEYMTVHYEKLAPLLIEAIKDLKKQLDTHVQGCSCNGYPV
jgi:hypothetical protein